MIMSNDLKKIREQIDALDDRIVELLNERASLAQEVGRVKNGSVAYRPAREAQVLRRLTALSKSNKGPLPEPALRRLYVEIMSACRALEAGIQVAYLGPQGTFTEEAARKQFGGGATLVSCTSIDEVFRTVEAEQGYGVVPIENSTEGSVGITHDLLLTTPLKICGEVLLPVHQNLMNKSGKKAGIKKVLGHSQSLAQCHAWLSRHLPNAKRIAVVSNAEAAKLAAKDVTAAALGSASAAGIYKLKLIETNIEDVPQNTTRFLVLAQHDAESSGKDKTSLVLSARNVPGAVHALLAPLAQHGISMTRFESRPARTGRWEYVFYVDIEGHREDARVKPALQALEKDAALFKVFGSYPVGVL